EVRDDVADPLPEEEERMLPRRSGEESLLSRRSAGDGTGRSVADSEGLSGASKIWGEGRDRVNRGSEQTVSEARAASSEAIARSEDLDAEGELDLSIDMLELEDLEESRRVTESAVKIQERLAQIQPKGS
ncbi:MAG: hypothetical protein VYD19_07455, partial [Myxococcota bacterium]|nr:hypothetical protein [Myxococcota bacterium]